jgi:endonuclease-8
VPEGDTVYRLARRLDQQLAGHTIVRSDLRHPRLVTRDLSGRRVLGHATHGKHLLTRLSTGLTLHSHLRMDGEWSLTRPGKRLPPTVQPHVRLALTLDSGETAWGVRLHDLALVPTRDERELVGHLGPDPLREDWDPVEAVRRLRADPGLPLVAALLDQRRLCGLGNLWVNELAFLVGAGPWTPVGQVDVETLVERAATMLRGSAHGPGRMQVTTGSTRRGEEHWVSGRAGRPCRRCGTTVRVVAEVPGDAARRRTWWCPQCQPGPGPGATGARR